MIIQAGPAPAPFGLLLRQYRLAAGLTQEALAEKARLSTRVIAELERGARRFPYAETLDRLARALSLAADDQANLRSSGQRSPRPRTAVAPLRRDPHHHLPIAMTRLIGRDAELAWVRQQLTAAGTRLVTLTGAGGVGKTRLALEGAYDLFDVFPDGIHFVPLEAINEPGQVRASVADAIAASATTHGSDQDRVCDYLRDRHCLLVLDNCEQVVGVCAALVMEILQSCPDVRILATSREPLWVRGEQTRRISPLVCSDPAVENASHRGGLLDAVELFVDRAQAVDAGFRLTDENYSVVATICKRLDGLPFAVELAATRVRLFTPYQILIQLDALFDVLVDGARVGPDRHRTMRSVLDWSYQLLSLDEERLLQRLSVFDGCFNLEQAGSAGRAAGVSADTVLSLVSRLFDKSFLEAQEQHGNMLYRMLETTRHYVRERRCTFTPSAPMPGRRAVYRFRRTRLSLKGRVDTGGRARPANTA